MNYNQLQQSANPNSIAECEWNEGQTLGFTKMTSCIGIVAVHSETKLFGLHLPVSIDSLITLQDWRSVLSQQGGNLQDYTCYLIGNPVGVWKVSCRDVYNAIKADLYIQSEKDADDKTWTVSMVNGAISIQ